MICTLIYRIAPGVDITKITWHDCRFKVHLCMGGCGNVRTSTTPLGFYENAGPMLQRTCTVRADELPVISLSGNESSAQEQIYPQLARMLATLWKTQ